MQRRIRAFSAALINNQLLKAKKTYYLATYYTIFTGPTRLQNGNPVFSCKTYLVR